MELESLKPKLVFLLGKQVASFVSTKLKVKDIELDDRFDFRSFTSNDIVFVPVHHPSYILVYKRRFIDDYARGIHSFLKKLHSKRSRVCV